MLGPNADSPISGLLFERCLAWFFVGDDASAPPFHAAEIPLPLDLSGSTGDFHVALSEVVIIAVGGRIFWRMFGAFLIGRGWTLLGPDLTPYSEFDDFFLQHPI